MQKHPATQAARKVILIRRRRADEVLAELITVYQEILTLDRRRRALEAELTAAEARESRA